MLNMPGGPEIVVVLLVALVVLGPDQLPKAMRTFGNVMAQVRKVSNGFQDEMRSAMSSLDVTAAAKSDTSSKPSRATHDDKAIDAVAHDATPSDPPPPTAAPSVDPAPDRPGTSSADRAAG